VKLFSFGKDGGSESTVSGLFFVEIKSLFSIAVLRFAEGSRDAYHDHAFNSISWVLSGALIEHHLNGAVTTHFPSIRPIITRRNTFHKVVSFDTTWVFTLRGPWAAHWHEFLPHQQEQITLTHGRKVVATGGDE
jgi:hypothetical protein